ncbi:MAG: bifunctional DNA-formamidopyrimidine glycosylase/DNA-(apurinic or apyrimidinic site) lyase [bacterium]
MPELPEVETIVRGLRHKVVGQRIGGVSLRLPKILRCDQGEFVRRVPGRTIRDVRRRGKLIIIELSGGWSLLVHLKMTGQLVWTPQAQPPQRHTHLVFRFRNCPFQLRYCDQRQFGYLLLLETARLSDLPPLRDLGPEPLEIGESEFVELLVSRTRRIKPLLLDQSFVAGLGNIYADESLWRARAHPLTRANRISLRKGRELLRAVQSVLTAAIEHRGSSVDTYRDAVGQPGQFQSRLQVYGREGRSCPRCGRRIRRLVISGRSSFFCPRCQRRLL